MVEENTGVEVALGAGSTEDQQEAPGSYHGLVARVESLEDLSRLTLARSCHQLYTRGIRQELYTRVHWSRLVEILCSHWWILTLLVPSQLMA